MFSARVFSLVFSIAYALVVYLNQPLFRYYPLARRWSFHDLIDPSLGPAMSWYGWIAWAAIAAGVASAVVPKSLGARIPAAVFWILPCIGILAGFYREWQWFQ